MTSEVYALQRVVESKLTTFVLHHRGDLFLHLFYLPLVTEQNKLRQQQQHHLFCVVSGSEKNASGWWWERGCRNRRLVGNVIGQPTWAWCLWALRMGSRTVSCRRFGTLKCVSPLEAKGNCHRSNNEEGSNSDIDKGWLEPLTGCQDLDERLFQ